MESLKFRSAYARKKFEGDVFKDIKSTESAFLYATMPKRKSIKSGRSGVLKTILRYAVLAAATFGALYATGVIKDEHITKAYHSIVGQENHSPRYDTLDSKMEGK